MKTVKRYERTRQALLAIAAAATLAIPAMASAQPAPERGGDGGGHDAGQRMDDRPPPPAPVALQGKVMGYNHGPRGEINGILLSTSGKLTQVNCPPVVGSLAATFAPIGKDVKLMGRKMPPRPGERRGGPDSQPPGQPDGPDGGPDAAPSNGREPIKADHDVYEFAGLDAADVPPPPAPGADAPATQVTGTVASLNYGRRGELNGATLDSGDFVDVGPRDAAQLQLAVGQKLTASGSGTPMTGGKTALIASEVNGKKIDRPKMDPSRRGMPPPPPDGADNGPPPPPPTDGHAPVGPGGTPPAR